MNAIKRRVSSYVRTSQEHINVHPQTSCVTFPNNSWYYIHLLPLQKFHTIITPTGSSESLQHSSIPLLVYSLGIKHWTMQSAPSPPPLTHSTHMHTTHIHTFTFSVCSFIPLTKASNACKTKPTEVTEHKMKGILDGYDLVGGC